VRETRGRLGHDHLPWLGHALEAGRDVKRGAGEIVLDAVGRRIGLAHNDAGRDADAHAQRHRPRGELGDRVCDRERGAHGALRRVLIANRIAEADDDAIAEMMQDEAAEAVDGFADRHPISGETVHQLFGIAAVDHARRFDEIGEQDGHVATLAMREAGGRAFPFGALCSASSAESRALGKRRAARGAERGQCTACRSGRRVKPLEACSAVPMANISTIS
jgi:hypothetical protein